MFTKAVALFAFIAAASAGVVYDHHVGAQSEQTIRGVGFAGLGTVSHQSKAVDSAYSSVRKHDTRVINPAVAAVAAPVAYAAQPHYAPAVAAAPVAYAAQAHYAPAVAAAPVAYAAQPHYAQAVAAAPVAYAQPAYAPVAKAVAAHPVAYAAPVAKAVAAPVSLLGVAYSAVPQVAHATFDGFGVHYGY